MKSIGCDMYSAAYKRYVLIMLTLVYAFNVADRGLIGILLQPIKEDLALSDTQLGFLTGIAFGLFYATLGIPIARWADRGNRVTITSIAIALFGGTVMLCVFVTNFIQLMAARIAAAVGESGCMPPTYSLLGDYFPAAAERTRAMAVYWLASPIANLASLALGGWLNQLYGWRLTFFLMGIPALLLAVLVKLTIREPRTHLTVSAVIPANSSSRREPIAEAGIHPAPDLASGRSPSGAPRIVDVLRLLWRRRSLRQLLYALIVLFTIGLGLSPWYAAFMIRSHGMSTAEVGLWFGLVFGVGGIAGTWLGGYVAGRWFAHDERAQMRVIALAIAAMLPCFVLFLMLPNKSHAMAAQGLLVAAFSFFLGPTFALLQRLVGDEMRATALAVVMLLANVIGMGIGPQVVGILSDALMPALGTDSLRYAMLVLSFLSLWAAYHFWQVGRTVLEDLVAVAQIVGTENKRLSLWVAEPASVNKAQ